LFDRFSEMVADYLAGYQRAVVKGGGR
jgi:hypothetical protein